MLVSRPEAAALAEAERSRRELAEIGVRNQQLALNGLFSATDHSDPLARALEDRQGAALAGIAPGLDELPRTTVPLLGFAPLGVGALGRVFESTGKVLDTPPSALPASLTGAGSLAELVDELAAPGHGLIMTMGKGGVGKTTIASAIAVELARRGHRVHLSTTDPAAHVSQTVAGELEGLSVSRIDPSAETLAYTEEVLERAGGEAGEQVGEARVTSVLVVDEQRVDAHVGHVDDTQVGVRVEHDPSRPVGSEPDR
ncbi:MAG: ArsA-related P-loop ATPase, partial [Acidimicrobiales bacterium]